MSDSTILGAWLFVCPAVVATIIGDPSLAPPPRPVDVAALVQRLGSEDFADREDATRRLSTLPADEVPPELLAALKSENPEVRERAAKAVKALRERIALARLPRAERFAKRGQIDLYVASTAASEPTVKVDDHRLWAPALDFGRRIVARSEMKGDRLPQGCPALCEDFGVYRAGHPDLRFVRTIDLFAPPKGYVRMYHRVIQAAGVTESESLHGLVISRGPVGAAGLSQSLVLATGDVASGRTTSCSVVVCDGDVLLGENVVKSLIVARGNITIEGWGYENTLIAGGKVTVKKAVALLNGQHLPREQENLIEEHARKPLGYITFFELSTVGIEAKAVDGVVQVTGLAADKPFADAGVKVGDVIAAVNGKTPDSPESLRRLLRDALAIGDATVKLQRGGKTEIVKVALPE